MRIGDAACSADPLSSQGVQKAMVSAVQGSTVIHTILTRPANSEAAVEFNCTGLSQTVAHLGQVTANFYAEQGTYRDEPFWRQRASGSNEPSHLPPQTNEALPLMDGPRVRLSAEITVKDVPVIQGNVIVPSPAVHHPNLERPVAYLEDIPLASLLTDLVSDQTVNEMLRGWAGKLPLATGWNIMNWPWSRQLLVPSEA